MSYSLHHIPTREEAYEILSKMKVAELLELAKENRVHVHKKNKKAIIERIVESTVGARLRSEAIKSMSLKKGEIIDRNRDLSFLLQERPKEKLSKGNVVS